MWAHSANWRGVRHGFSDHARTTAALAGRFGSAFNAEDLTHALGLFHDAGKTRACWQQGLIRAEERGGGPVGEPHKQLGAALLRNVAGPAAMAILGHHGGLTAIGDLDDLDPAEAAFDDAAVQAFFEQVSEAESLLTPEQSMIPDSWRRSRLVAEIGIRLAFSALVDADHLDTAAHFAGLDEPRVRPDADMEQLRDRFEAARTVKRRERAPSPIDALRETVYRHAIEFAVDEPGIFRMPAPTGVGKTWAGAGFGLHHAAIYGKSRVIVAVPFITVTEQNAAEYRNMLGEDVVLEHHSAVQPAESRREWRMRSAVENWDSPFVVTTTVQLFDSLFARKPAQMRKLHRLANSVVILDEIQALPLRVLTPILDALRTLSEDFGTTVLLTSATQPSFHALEIWDGLRVRDVVDEPRALFKSLRRVRYQWWLDPKPRLAEVSENAATYEQVLMVVNTTADARTVFQSWSASGDEEALHLSTRMYPQHRQEVLKTVRARLRGGRPLRLVSTQLIEAGVDLDSPVVFRAYAPAEALQQAAGRANREGKRDEPGLVVVFDAEDMTSPAGYSIGSKVTGEIFGPQGKTTVDPDDLDALDDYYQTLYQRSNAEYGTRATEIQRNRNELDFQSVAEGPERARGLTQTRDASLAFRMLDDDTVPVVVTERNGPTPAAELVHQLRDEPEKFGAIVRKLQPYIVALPKRLLQDRAIAALCRPVVGDLHEWLGEYDENYGVDTSSGDEQEVW